MQFALDEMCCIISVFREPRTLDDGCSVNGIYRNVLLSSNGECSSTARLFWFQTNSESLPHVVVCRVSCMCEVELLPDTHILGNNVPSAGYRKHSSIVCIDDIPMHCHIIRILCILLGRSVRQSIFFGWGLCVRMWLTVSISMQARVPFVHRHLENIYNFAIYCVTNLALRLPHDQE